MNTLHLAKYVTAAGAAKALYRHFIELAAEKGLGTAGITLMNPAESEAWGSGKFWRVIWEGSGLPEWGVCLSMNDDGLDGTLTALGVYYDYESTDRRWYLEPYYSFDVVFVTT